MFNIRPWRLGTFTLRGYDSAARKFSFYVRDRYGNVSDTMTKTYKPLYEKALDKKLFKKVQLPTDIGDDWGLPMRISGMDLTSVSGICSIRRPNLSPCGSRLIWVLR